MQAQKLGLRGRYRIDHFRQSKFFRRYEINNDVTNEGKNTIFDTMFNGTSQLSLWYIGLIDNSGFSALAATDVASSHAGWTEFTGYSQANRVQWVSGTPVTGQSITNATPSQFDMTGSGTIQGIFIISNNTKSGTTGTTWSTALFSAPVPVVTSDQLKVTYTLNA